MNSNQISVAAIPYYVIAILFIYIIYLTEFKAPTPLPTETKTDTLIVSDTVYSTAPSETISVSVPFIIYDTVYVFGDTLTEYKSFHTDIRISASWKTGVFGELRYQDFEYSLLKTPVITNTVYVNTNRYVTREVNVVKPYLSAGFELGGNESMFTVSPSILYTSKNRNTYYIKYDLVHNAYYLGITKPLLTF